MTQFTGQGWTLRDAVEHLQGTDHPRGCHCRVCVFCRSAIRAARCRHKGTRVTCVPCSAKGMVYTH